MSPSRIRSLVLALVVGALVAPSAAQASPTQMSIMMDDDLLVYRDDTTAAKTLTQMKSLGVDTVRVTVLWKTVAEYAKFTKGDLAKLKASKKGKSAKAVQRAIDAARRQNMRFKAAKVVCSRAVQRASGLARNESGPSYMSLLSVVSMWKIGTAASTTSP